MPIKVACKCGQKFAAKDELAGRVVKCPKCSQALRIPAAKQSAGQAPAAAPQQPAAPAPTPPAGMGAPSGTIFDEFDLGQNVTGNICPNCLEGIPPKAMVCTHCGFRMDSGEVMETEKGSEKVKRGHKKVESMGNEQLDAAAKQLEKDKRESKMEDDQSSWWVYLMAVFIIGSVSIVGMLNTPENVIPTAADGESGQSGPTATGMGIAYAFMGLVGVTGSLMTAYAWVMAMIVSFSNEENKIHGILNAVLCNIYPPFYLGLRTSHYESIFEIYVAGTHTMMLAWMMGVAFTTSGTSGGWAAIGVIIMAVFAIIGGIMTAMNWAQIATYAYEEEESLTHAVLCCVLGALYGIIYGIMRWANLRQPVLRIFLAMVISICPYVLGLEILFLSLIYAASSFASLAEIAIVFFCSLGFVVVIFCYFGLWWWLSQLSRD